MFPEFKTKVVKDINAWRDSVVEFAKNEITEKGHFEATVFMYNHKEHTEVIIPANDFMRNEQGKELLSILMRGLANEMMFDGIILATEAYFKMSAQKPGETKDEHLKRVRDHGSLADDPQAFDALMIGFETPVKAMLITYKIKKKHDKIQLIKMDTEKQNIEYSGRFSHLFRDKPKFGGN